MLKLCVIDSAVEPTRLIQKKMLTRDYKYIVNGDVRPDMLEKKSPGFSKC